MAESEEALKRLLMKVKEESEQVGLKLSIHETKTMASGPITSCQIDGETVTDFFFWGASGAPKSLQIVTEAMKLIDTCSLEEKLWKSIKKLWKSIKKQRHYFANKGPSSQRYGFFQ